ncbi:MAG: hypothetical protein U0T82_04855 [Bacteroidales bacterium]
MTFIRLLVLHGRYLFCLLVYLIFLNGGTYGQDRLSNGKALNIPFKRFGLSFGNSHAFNGIRFNVKDRETKVINGFNFTIGLGDNWDKNKLSRVNGISAGLFPMAYGLNGLGIGIFGPGFHNFNGLGIGGLVVAGSKVNGIAVSGLIMGGRTVSGIGIAGFMAGAEETFNGIVLSGIGISLENELNGIGISSSILVCNNTIRGTAITLGYLKSENLYGLAVGGYVAVSNMHGIAVSLFNNSKELHGLQLGVLNHAANNPRGLRWLPGMNLHL